MFNHSSTDLHRVVAWGKTSAKTVSYRLLNKIIGINKRIENRFGFGSVTVKRPGLLQHQPFRITQIS